MAAQQQKVARHSTAGSMDHAAAAFMEDMYAFCAHSCAHTCRLACRGHARQAQLVMVMVATAVQPHSQQRLPAAPSAFAVRVTLKPPAGQPPDGLMYTFSKMVERVPLPSSSSAGMKHTAARQAASVQRRSFQPVLLSARQAHSARQCQGSDRAARLQMIVINTGRCMLPLIPVHIGNLVVSKCVHVQHLPPFQIQPQ